MDLPPMQSNYVSPQWQYLSRTEPHGGTLFERKQRNAVELEVKRGLNSSLEPVGLEFGLSGLYWSDCETGRLALVEAACAPGLCGGVGEFEQKKREIA